MNLFIAILLTLLVILASLFYLLKVKNENHGPFYRWAGLMVLACAAGLFLFLVFKGVKRLVRHDHRDYHEMHLRKEGKVHKKKGRHSCMQNQMDACFRMHNPPMDGDSVQTEIFTDSLDGKVIRKEIKVIKKKE